MAQLLAGAAKRKITPSADLLARMAKTDNRAFDGVDSDIYVRAIVLSDGETKVLLGGADLGMFPAQQKLCNRLNAKYGIDPLGCVLSCTHNHEAPRGAFPGEEDAGRMAKPPFSSDSEASVEYGKLVHDMMDEAVAEAVANLTPARMGVGKGLSYINACRDLPTPIGGIQINNFHAPSDHELIVLRFDALSGGTIGMFVNHATHSNAMVWNVTDRSYPKINADVGGGVSQFVERVNGDKFPVVWAMGCAGDQNPIVRSSWRIISAEEDGSLSMEQVTFNYKDNLLQMKQLIATQALEIMELSRKMSDFTEEFSFEGAETYREIPARKSYRELKIAPLCGERPEPVPNGTLTFRFRLAKICGVAFAGINGEIYTRLGLMIKDMLHSDTTVVTTLAFGGVGYIPDAKQEWINGFGTMNTSALTGAHTESAFVSGFGELKGKLGL